LVISGLLSAQRARGGGDFPWVGKPGVMYSSCTDGRQTVVFKLERIED
jgi:uncharacterized repeat protein (TIGR04076 family)